MELNFLILFFFIFILLVFILCLFKSKFFNLKKSESFNFLDNKTATTMLREEKKDCNLTIVYSIRDDDCNMICKNSDVFISQNGICVNSIMKQKETQLICNPKLGFVSFLTGNSEFGQTKLVCMSVDLGIQSNDTKEKNIICRNGKIDINYLKKFPSIDECVCTVENTILTIIPATNTIREHSICLNKRLKNVFEWSKLIRDKIE